MTRPWRTVHRLGGPGRRGEPGQFVAGARLAISTLTVVPVRPNQPDRATATVAMTLAPAAGLVLGVAAFAVGLGVSAAGASTLVAAVLTVAAVAVLTRGLHLDGLADTADGLGSYAEARQALAIMRRPEIGPFGVCAVVLVLFAQVAAAVSVLDRPRLAAAAAVASAVAAGRASIALACRRGIAAARPDGMGTLFAATVHPLGAAIGCAAVAALATAALPGRPWQGPLAVIAGLGCGTLLTRHVVRRLGGITGDTLGAACEISSTVTWVLMSL